MRRTPSPLTNAPALRNTALLLLQLEIAFASSVKLTTKMDYVVIQHKTKPIAIEIGAGELDEYMWSSEGTLLINVLSAVISNKIINVIIFQTLKRSANTPIINDSKRDVH